MPTQRCGGFTTISSVVTPYLSMTHECSSMESRTAILDKTDSWVECDPQGIDCNPAC